MKVGELRKLLDGVDDDLEVTIRGGNVELRARVQPLQKGQAADPRKPVCDTCDDTHEMTLHREGEVDQVVMCTRCPRPCQECRAGRIGPFCETTPCGCGCHRKEPKK